MAKVKNFDFDVDEIEEADDVYNYDDLEDLSLIPPKNKSVKEQEKKKKNNSDYDDAEDDVEKIATKLMKIFGIIILIVMLAAGVFFAVKYLLPIVTGNSYVDNYNNGVIAYEAGEYESAIASFEKALTFKDTNNINERIYMYKSYKALNQEDAAINCLVELLEYDQMNAEAIQVVASYYASTGNVDKISSMVEKYSNTEAYDLLIGYLIKSPVASFDSGSYDRSIYVELTCESGDAIYYTLDGREPSVVDTIYTEPIHIVEGITTLKAAAINQNGNSSSVSTYDYEIIYYVPEAPVVEPASGSFTENTQISVTDYNEGLSLYYTLDGSVPTIESEKYVEPIDMPGGNNVFSFCYITGDGVSSEVVTRNYNLKVSEKYSYNDSVSKIKKLLIKNGVLNSDGDATVDGKEVKFVYYAKRKVDGVEMYLMYYDVKIDGVFQRQNMLYGVDIQKGNTYSVADVDGTLVSKEYK